MNGRPATSATRPRRTASVMSAMIAVLSVIAVALAVVLVVSKDDESTSGGTSESVDRAVDRDAVTATASEFVEVANTLSAEDLITDGSLSAYGDRLSEFVTPELERDIDGIVERAEETVAESGYRRTAIVTAADIALLEQDSATVTVTATISTTSGGKQSEDQELRYAVDLKRAESGWLVDDMQVVDD